MGERTKPTSEENERQSSFLNGTLDQPQFTPPESPFTNDSVLRELREVLLPRQEWQARPTRGDPLTLITDLRNKNDTRILIDPNRAWQKTSTPGVEVPDNRLGALIIITSSVDFFQMRRIENLIGSMIRPLRYKSPIVILEEKAGLDLVEPLTPQLIKKGLQTLGSVNSKTLTSRRTLGPLAETHRLTLTRAPAPRKKWPKEKDPSISPAVIASLQEKFRSSTSPFRATPEHNIDLHPPTNEPGITYEDPQGNVFIVTEIEIRPGVTQLAGIRELRPSEKYFY